MHYCLNKDELRKFLLFKTKQEKLWEEDEMLRIMIEHAESWYGEISLLTYLLSQVFESLEKQQIQCGPLLNMVYELSGEMCVYLQEFEISFVDYMLSHLRNNDSLEENLIELQNDWRENSW